MAPMGEPALLFFYVLSTATVCLMMGIRVHGELPRKLFIFGDSYVDAGNLGRIVHHEPARSWKEPYGITFPGRPTGRFSDGRVFSDYVAKFLRVRSPIPYKYRKYGKALISCGMNFAHGGAGIFDTWNHEANLSVQIDQLEEQIRENVFTTGDLRSSMALVAISGNDYLNYYLTHNGDTLGLLGFISQVVNQAKSDLWRLGRIGIRKVAVMGLQPVGCLPVATVNSSYTSCNGLGNLAADIHNSQLQEALRQLNGDSSGSVFSYVNIYDGFMKVISSKGNGKFQEPLKPCCVGLSSGYECGNVGAEGTKEYTLCDKAGGMFFWDDVHPSQAGWAAVYDALRPSLARLL